jgi:hypothetical protein
MSFQENKNDKQVHFNHIKGEIIELNTGDRFCSITLDVGHENPRQVNLSLKKHQFDKLTEKFKMNDKVVIRYFLSSKKKSERWYTTANVLDVQYAD